jgi:hypothetical protein
MVCGCLKRGVIGFFDHALLAFSSSTLCDCALIGQGCSPCLHPEQSQGLLIPRGDIMEEQHHLSQQERHMRQVEGDKRQKAQGVQTW